MRLDFWHRTPSRKELEAAEQRGFERYKRHVNIDQLKAQMAQMREHANRLEVDVYELEALLSHTRPHVSDESLRAAIDRRIGPDPEQTAVVAKIAGGFAVLS